jgi:serine/threonine protein phosphatase PrpC
MPPHAVIAERRVSRHMLKAFGITHTGRVRRSNEDQFLIAELTKAMRIWQTSLPDTTTQFGDEHGHLFLVADGMGGHLGGAQASTLAVLAIQQFTLNTFKWFFEPNRQEAQRVLAEFQAAIRQADVDVRQEAAERQELSGMGTTVTMAYHLEAQLCVVHVGDSRAYVFREGELHQLTRDHTFTADLLERGSIAAADVRRHPLRHIITNVVGGTDAGVEVEAHAFEVQKGDCLLLCSDGLTEMLTDDVIAATLRASPDPELAGRRLVDQANEAGGLDNVTVIIAEFQDTVPSERAVNS